jgi:hypothetical protein
MSRIIAIFNFFLLSFLLISIINITADTLVEVSSTSIAYGNAATQIGLVEGGGEHWKPLFFAVDAEGSIHIPDFYKARIAVYDKAGKLKEAKPCPAGISPRMNYFGMSSQGTYVAFGDGSLYVIKKDGKLAWQYNFGYGIIPARIIPSQSALFLILPPHVDRDGRAIVFDYGSATPLGRYGKELADRRIPLIQWGEDTVFTPMLKDMRALEGFKGKFIGSDKACFVAADKEGKSLWSEKSETGETIYLFSKSGDLISKGYIAFQGAMPATGFWTVADDELTIYKNYFFKDHMLVVGYRFKK